MKKLIIVTLLIMVASCATVKKTTRTAEEHSSRTAEDSSALTAAEDQDHLILATLWFQKSAEMRALYYQCFRNAERALKENLELQRHTPAAQEHSPEPFPAESRTVAGQSADEPVADYADHLPRKGLAKTAAVVLDIDETLLDNSPFQGWQILEKESFNNDDWFRWVELARARPLPGAVEFTLYADSLGVVVFYVSNRTVEEMGPTIKNMEAWGFVNADSTHMLLKEATSSKVERRALIEKEYEILLLVGDNLADHSSVYENRGPDYGFEAVDADRHLFGTKYIVLPNPMYGNWLKEIVRSAPGSTEHEKLLKMLEGF